MTVIINQDILFKLMSIGMDGGSEQVNAVSLHRSKIQVCFIITVNWFCSIFPLLGVVFVEFPIGSLQIESVTVFLNSFTKFNLLYNGFRSINTGARRPFM